MVDPTSRRYGIDVVASVVTLDAAAVGRQAGLPSEGGQAQCPWGQISEICLTGSTVRIAQ
jgi:hypothetical protein